MRNGLVVGTGDLSELALGWCTYGVGDHMSHYSVNASVPKTLIQYIIRWVSSEGMFGKKASRCLESILDTEISPELVPGTGSSCPAQSTEGVIGPYELQDFNTFYITRYGYLPSKVAFLAYCAWLDTPGEMARHTAVQEAPIYPFRDQTLAGVFIHRFFKTSQFKRSCIPNAPKVGSGGSLSPRAITAHPVTAKRHPG
jgi:NAD+ synthase (glutamine-hydrolysing)